jgi:hypothetical protein
MLEALKLYLDSPNCVYVLGVDREPLEAAVTAQYGSLGLRTESYLDKIIQLPFAIPAIDEEGMNQLVQSAIPDHLAACRPVLQAAAADVPRDVKRMSNALLLSDRLAVRSIGDGYRPEILALLILIQNQAPDRYRALRSDPERLHELYESRPQSDPSAYAAEQDVETSPGEQKLGMWQQFVSPRPRLQKGMLEVDLSDRTLDLTPYLTLTRRAGVFHGKPGSEPRALPSVVLSAVTSEFGRIRDEVARDLRRKGFEVIRLEDSADQSKNVLERLENGIRSCNVVVAIGGHRSGAVPPTAVAEPYSHLLPSDLEEASYNQWAVIFALHYEKTLYLFEASFDYPPDQLDFDAQNDDSELQQRFAKWLRDGPTDIFRFSTDAELQIALRRTDISADASQQHGLTVEEPKRGARQRRRRGVDDLNRLPTNDRGFVGREHEIQDVLEAIEQYGPLIVLVGPAGVGKRALLQALTHHAALPQFTDGSAIHPVVTKGMDLEDLERVIWEEFVESDDLSIASSRRRRKDLRVIEALILLPDADDYADVLPDLVRLMPKTVFCVSVSEEPALRLQAELIAIEGLDDNEMFELFADRYGHSIPDEASADVHALCTAAEGDADRVELLARRARREARPRATDVDQHPLVEWARTRLANAADDLALVATVTPTDTSVPPVPREVMAAVTGTTGTAIDDAIAAGLIEPA